MTVDSAGRVYVSDPEGYRILVYTEDGQPLESWGDFGVEANAFALPSGMAIDAQGNVWVADTNNHRVMRFTQQP